MKTQAEALKIALEWYDSGEEDRAEFEEMIKSILVQPEHKCTRSHPHENMSRECELLTEIARLQNKLAQPKEQEPVAWPVEEQPDGSVIPVDPSEMTAEQLQQ